MKTEKRGRGRPRGVQYTRKLPVYDTEGGMALLQALARRRGISAAAVVRQLVREEAGRIGIEPPPMEPDGGGEGNDEGSETATS